tara:strand:+ start:99735 stop:100328 length:594 start_codon:yes stop_codon:yes gene_type:complete
MLQKKLLYFWLLCLLIIGLSQPLLSQNIKVNSSPVAILKMPFTLGLGVEQKLSLHQSLEFSGDLYFQDRITTHSSSDYGYRLNLSYRYYFGNKRTYDGFYIAPSLVYLKADVSSGGLPLDPNYQRLESFRQAFGLQIAIGYQWIFYDVISFGVGFAQTTYRSYDYSLNNSLKVNESWKNDIEFNPYLSLGVLIFQES